MGYLNLNKIFNGERQATVHFLQKMSTQILTKKIKLENNFEKHISIKERISKIFPDTTVHAVSVDYDETPSKNQLVLERTLTSHGLAAAIFHAYNKHQHLRLTPDDIWLTIAQGVSQHINYNAEKFRYSFVNHKDKKEINVWVRDILCHKNSRLEGDWPEAVNRCLSEMCDRLTYMVKICIILHAITPRR